MNIEKMITALFGGVITVAILTTILGRSNTPKVLDAVGKAGGNLISAALGAGADIR